MACPVVLALWIFSLYSLVYTNQFLNVERQRALPKNIPHPFPDIFVDEPEEDVFLEPFVSRPELELRSASSDLSNLKLAAFNVRIFGKRKMGTPRVSEIIVQVSTSSVHRKAMSKVNRVFCRHYQNRKKKVCC